MCYDCKSAMILTGSVVGISVGKNVTYFLKYRQAESISLNAVSSNRT